uniref:Uncharacterized protein n=1 Tax=Setaria digitata TaxID=48799 RepID=A0A915PDY4_9BILA
MPPQKSLIAELLEKQMKVEQTERETAPHGRESSYYNLDDVQPSKSIISSISTVTNQQPPNTTHNIQKNIHLRSMSETNTTTFHDSFQFSDSGSAELPTIGSGDSLNSHNAFEIFAWNQKKKWENPIEAKIFGTKSEYCYCSNSSQPY